MHWIGWLLICFILLLASYYLHSCLTRRHQPKVVEPLLTSEELLVIEAHLQLNAGATSTIRKLASAFVGKRDAHATKVVQLELGLINALLIVIGGLTKAPSDTDRFSQAVDFIIEIVKVCVVRNKPLLKALHAAKRTSGHAGVDESLLTSLVEMLAVFLQTWMKSAKHVPPTLLGPSFTRLIANYFVNESVWDISLRIRLYSALMELVTYCQEDVTIWGQLCRKLKSREKLAFYDRLSVISAALEAYVQSTGALNAAQGADNIDERIKKLATSTKQILASRPATNDVPNHNDQNPKAVYEIEMQPFQFECVPFFDRNGNIAIPYAFTKSLRPIGGLDRRTRRLAQEMSALRVGLPLGKSGSIFVRLCEERLDVMKVLITGPVGTPYANGCFVFDVFMPPNYPDEPPHVQLMTTGNGNVRFNPNLYACGKVCLSLLNTWTGLPSERWSASSSLLQVLVSIQSLILVEDPYFNEPGYESMRATADGQAASTSYNEKIQMQSALWAIKDMLRRPPTPFADVIRRHFWLKRHEILRDIESWLRYTETNRKYKSSLESTYRWLKTEFSRMTEPKPR